MDSHVLTCTRIPFQRSCAMYEVYKGYMGEFIKYTSCIPLHQGYNI
jgi:hypothetical protein